MQARAASGKPTDPEALTRVYNSLSRLLADLELTPEGAAARRERERQAAIEAEQRRMGINARRPGER
jgi:hypothetical protein